MLEAPGSRKKENMDNIIRENYYHIYNHGNAGEKIFRCTDDYNRFLKLMDKYILSVADIFAWVLMPNHFHFLVRIKSGKEIGYYLQHKDPQNEEAHKFKTTGFVDAARTANADTGRYGEIIPGKIPTPSKHFSHMFNAYTKYYNKKYRRRGSLFEKNYRRKEITNPIYFKNLVIYIHNNPVYHGFCDYPVEYPWSSYLTCISVKHTNLARTEILGWFDEVGNFKSVHEQYLRNPIIDTDELFEE